MSLSFPNRLQPGLSLMLVDSIEIQSITRQYNLKSPETFGTPTQREHCLAISFNVIKNYLESSSSEVSANETITKVIQAMKLTEGANAACAKTSVIYNELFTINKDAVNSQTPFLLRQAVANTLGLIIREQLELQGSTEDIVDYLLKTLADGGYVISLPHHLVTLIKKENELHLLDPGGKWIKINTNSTEAKELLLKFFVGYKIPLQEFLTLLKLDKKIDESPVQVSSFTIPLSEEVPSGYTFTPLKGTTEWKQLEITWRKTKYFFIQHVATGEIYNGDSTKLLRLKFILLALGRTAIDTTIRVIYHLALFVLKGIKLLFLSLLTRRDVTRLKLEVAQSFLDLFRAPLYGIAMTVAAIYGLYNPYQGRRLYGVLEKGLNRGQSFREKWYTAPCFMPLATKGDTWNFKMEKHINLLNYIKLRQQGAFRSLCSQWMRQIACCCG